jgi:hypothetical protein
MGEMKGEAISITGAAGSAASISCNADDLIVLYSWFNIL